MTRAFIGMGSNIDPERNVRQAVRLLASRVRILDISTVYLTDPIGNTEQARYYNCVAAIETELLPLELKLTVLRRIEDLLGRKRNNDRYGPRTIDLDLVLYGDLVLKTEGLDLPDPDILVRPYLAYSLREIAPDLVLPGSSIPISAVADRLKDPTIKQLDSYTALLKEEIRNGPGKGAAFDPSASDRDR